MNILNNLFLAHLLHIQYGAPVKMTYKVFEAFESAPELKSLNNDLNKIRAGKLSVIKNSIIDNAFKCIEDLIDVSIETQIDLDKETKEVHKRQNKAMSRHIKQMLLDWLRDNNVTVV